MKRNKSLNPISSNKSFSKKENLKESIKSRNSSKEKNIKIKNTSFEKRIKSLSPIINLKTKNLEKKNLQSSKLKLKTNNIILKDSLKIKKINKTTKINELNKPTNIKKKIKNDFNYLNDLTKNINSLISEFKKNEINLNKENEILNEEKKDEDQIIKTDIDLNEGINNFKNNISEMEKLILQRESYQSQIDFIFNSN